MTRSWSGIGRSKTSPLYRLFDGIATLRLLLRRGYDKNLFPVRTVFSRGNGRGKSGTYSLMMYPKFVDMDTVVRVITPANIAEVGVRKSPNKKKAIANMLKENRGENYEKESMQTAIPLVMFGNISFVCVCVLKVDKIYLQISPHRSYLTKLILSVSYSFSSSCVMQK